MRYNLAAGRFDSPRTTSCRVTADRFFRGGKVERIALFDVDGTLVDGHVWRAILSHPEVSRWRVRWLYARTIPAQLARKAGWLDETSFRDGWVRGLAGLLRGQSRDWVRRLAEWTADEFLASMYRQDVIGVLKEHKRQGDSVVLVSTMFTDVLEAISRRLDADAWLGTALSFTSDGTANGRLDSKSCVGPHKLDFVRDYLSAHRKGSGLEACVAYADSGSDLPLLAAVGEAVAVYPDSALRQEALARGWRLLPADETR